MFPVRAKEDGSWHDTALGRAHAVKVGDVVEFSDRRDAEHFVGQGRAEWAFADDAGNDDPKPKKARGKAKRDAEEEAGEQAGDAD